MRKLSCAVMLAVVVVLSFSLVQTSFSRENAPETQLMGKWQITHRPVDKEGKPCPFLPETIEFFKDRTLLMSNFPGVHLAYKIEITEDERKALEQRSEWFKGKRLLLVRPNPRMGWTNTPMVYVYAVTKDGLSLTVEGWDTATFKQVK